MEKCTLTIGYFKKGFMIGANSPSLFDARTKKVILTLKHGKYYKIDLYQGQVIYGKIGIQKSKPFTIPKNTKNIRLDFTYNAFNMPIFVDPINDKSEMDNHVFEEGVKSIVELSLEDVQNIEVEIRDSRIKDENSRTEQDDSHQVKNKVDLFEVKRKENLLKYISIVFSAAMVIMSLYFLVTNISGTNGDVQLALNAAEKHFQKMSLSGSLTSSELKCKSKGKSGDIFLIQCKTNNDFLISFYETRDIWYGYVPTVDRTRYWEYSANNKNDIINQLSK